MPDVRESASFMAAIASNCLFIWLSVKRDMVMFLTDSIKYEKAEEEANNFCLSAIERVIKGRWA
jgi:hypothetical protein